MPSDAPTTGHTIGLKIALIGVPGSGKTRLATAITTHLPQHTVADAPDWDALRLGGFDRILLTGLDLPGCSAHGTTDHHLRQALAQAGLTYGVVYGSGGHRLRQALRLIAPEAVLPTRWHGVCEKCADPECERRLFTGLKA